MRLATNLYTLHISEAQTILYELQPDRYRSHTILADMLSNAVTRAHQQGHEQINLYVLASLRSVCKILNRFLGISNP